MQRLWRLARRRRSYLVRKIRVFIAYGALQGAVSVAEFLLPTVLSKAIFFASSVRHWAMELSQDPALAADARLALRFGDAGQAPCRVSTLLL